MGLLASAVGGLGEGAMQGGKLYGEYAAHSALQGEANEFQRLRDLRLEEFASAREQRGYQHSERLQGAAFKHSEKLQGEQLDFTAIENMLNREQQTSESTLNRASHERIAGLGRASAEKIAGMHGTVQVDKDGKIQWVGARGEVVDTGLMSQKDLSPSAKVAADILRDQLKAIDKAESEGTGNPQTIAQQRSQVQGQLLAVLAGDLNKAFGGGNEFAGRSGYDPATKKVYNQGQEIGSAGSQTDAFAMITKHRAGAAGQTKASLIYSEVVPAGQEAPDVDSMVKPVQRGGGFYVDVPGVTRGAGESALSSLRGRTFATREEAVREASALLGYGL